MQGLITDRTQYDVSRCKQLSAKGWAGMTTDERIEWSGNPLETTFANLLSCGPYYSSSVSLKYRNQEIIATSSSSGIYLYAVSIIGEAVNYENKTFTLSVEEIISSGDATPQISAYWHDDAGFEYAGVSLLHSGSMTFNTADFPNTNNRKYLALYIYVTSDVSITSGTTVQFKKVMLNRGSAPQKYVPYTEVLSTDCTKGAYNYSDLNRVERAVEEISDLSGLSLETKTDWKMWDIPKASDMERYLYNIVAIRDHFSISTDLPASMNNLNYTYANNIEKTLFEAYEKLVSNGGVTS